MNSISIILIHSERTRPNRTLVVNVHSFSKKSEARVVVAVGGVEVQREVEDRKEVVVQSVAVEAQMAVVDVEHIHILEALVH